MSNQLEDLLQGKSSKSEEQKSETKKKKFSLLKDKTVLYTKELKYPLSLTVALLIFGGIANNTLMNEESEFHVNKLYGEGRAEIEDIEKNTIVLVNSTKAMESELAVVSDQISDKKMELDNANATITNLTQGYYFIAYLDSLFDKHNITLDRFDINLENTSISSDKGKILTVDNLVDITIPKGDYSLLPLDIEFTTASKNLRLLFDEFYTRRIVYDKDLQIKNNLDNSVTVRTKIEFTNSTAITEEQVKPQENSEVNPNLNLITPSGSDDWDLSSSSVPQSQDDTSTEGSGE